MKLFRRVLNIELMEKGIRKLNTKDVKTLKIYLEKEQKVA